MRSPTSRLFVVTLLSLLSMALVPRICLAQSKPTSRPADPGKLDDAAILDLMGDTIAGKSILNSCGARVKPTLSFLTDKVAVAIETDTTGACSGSNLPSTLTVLVHQGASWKLSTSTIGSAYRVGSEHTGYPAIIIQYPPYQHDCPILQWTGSSYRMIKSCKGTSQ